MIDWQQRVVDEKRELDGRRDRLSAFLMSDLSIDPAERNRLTRQAMFMAAYSGVLQERIDNFKG